MNRTDIINYLIEKYDLKSYLEIGVGDGSNFRAIRCDNKACVSPQVDNDLDGAFDDITYPMTSDEYFSTVHNIKYDIIFVDGLHEGNQVIRDIINSLANLNDNGFVVIHDSIPLCANDCKFPRDKEGIWNGDVYKAYPILAELGFDYTIINIDFGCGIIQNTNINQKLTENILESEQYPNKSGLNYEQVFYGETDLNIISEYEFLNKF